MKAIGFKSQWTGAVFLGALLATGIGCYAIGVDGAQHVWIPLMSALWLAFTVMTCRDQQAARQERMDKKIDATLAEIVLLNTTVTGLAQRMTAIDAAVQDYGDRRQITGHLASLHHEVEDTQRLVAGSTSNVRVLPGRR